MIRRRVVDVIDAFMMHLCLPYCLDYFVCALQNDVCMVV